MPLDAEAQQTWARLAETWPDVRDNLRVGTIWELNGIDGTAYLPDGYATTDEYLRQLWARLDAYERLAPDPTPEDAAAPCGRRQYDQLCASMNAAIIREYRAIKKAAAP